MAAQHLPRYLGGLAVDKRRTRSNERRRPRGMHRDWIWNLHFRNVTIFVASPKHNVTAYFAITKISHFSSHRGSISYVQMGNCLKHALYFIFWRIIRSNPRATLALDW